MTSATEKHLLINAAELTLRGVSYRDGHASCDLIRRLGGARYVGPTVEKYRAIMGYPPEGPIYGVRDDFFLALERIKNVQERQELRCWLLLMAAAAWDDF